MQSATNFTLVNPQNGNLAFKLLQFEDNSYFDHLQRNNFYSLIWITEGSGTLKADFAQHDISCNHLLAFSPYQPFMITAQNLKGIAIHFHPDFFCIHKHQSEVACNGILFNNIYQPPLVMVNKESATIFNMLIQQITNEIQNNALAQYELLIAYLKIFLITTCRLKATQNQIAKADISNIKEPFILRDLKDILEKDFKTKHSVSSYAEALHISPKALAKIIKTHFNKTLTALIAERIIIEAKRELYLTNKTVKEIAYELGYDDEFYFSRFFKNNADVSPQIYRETVGFARALAQ